MVAKKKATTKKAAAKKAPAKKATTKKAAVKKTAVKKAAPKKITAIKEPMTKSALFATIAERTELSKKDVAAVFGELENIIDGHVRKRAAGTFTLPGLMKITTVKKPARKARKGINPFTGEETMFKAKPAQTVVKIRPLKKLKDFVNN
jgi:nucleoid DNA-binding protein